MKRCKICHVEAELEDGRCHSCRMAKEATDHHMTYGKYKASIMPEDRPKPKEKTPDILTTVCEYCGKPFPKFGARRYCSSYCQQMRAYDKEVAQRAANPIPAQECPVCHKIFTPTRRGGIIYCSRVCCDSKAAAYLRLEAKKNDQQRTD